MNVHGARRADKIERALLLRKISDPESGADYRILVNRLKRGACPECERPIPGIWERPPSALET